MKYILLTDKFYNDFSNCSEIEKKTERPYIDVLVNVDGIQFAVPFRSSINHPYSLLTDKENHCGLDFSKSVIITNEEYISKDKHPHIRENEHKNLIGKEYIVKQKLKKYINDYKKAKKNPNVLRNSNLIKYSTLQYFDEYIDKLETTPTG